MPIRHIVLLLACALLPAASYTQVLFDYPDIGQARPSTDATISPRDLIPATGSWEGSLTYLDYTSGKPFTMPAHIEIGQVGNTNEFRFANTFPEEMDANWTDTIRISEDGRKLNDEWVRFNIIRPDGNREIVTEVLGADGNDNLPALLRYSYLIGPDIFIRHKQVQFLGTEEWIIRHEYRYDKRAKTLSPAQLQRDLAILRTTWEQLHPGLYRYNTPAQIDAYFKTLAAQCQSPMEQRRLYLLLSQLNAKLHCGHSYVSYYNNRRILKANLFSRVHLPLLFRVLDGQLVVTHHMLDDSPLHAGDRIKAINGIPAQQIVDSLLSVSKADGINGLPRHYANLSIRPGDLGINAYTLFDIYFPLFFKPNLNATTYTLELESTDGKPYRLACEGLRKAERLERFEAKYGKVPEQQATWSLKAIDKQTALFTVGDLATYNWDFDYKTFLDSIFTEIKTAGYQNLVLDIRGNEGGEDAARDAILSYLTPKDIPCLAKSKRLLRYLSVPDSLRPYLSTWDDSFYGPRTGLKKRKGFYEAKDACVSIAAHPNHFSGKTYLITDAANSSATFVLAKAFKDHQLGIIVGEATGGSQQGINGGQIFFFTLPHSKIEMDLPLIWQAPVAKLPDAGIQPDHLIKTTAADIAAGRDPQLDYILTKLIPASK
jgi:hypothetical protein